MEFNNYKVARSFGNLSIAAGENHFTRSEFARLIEDNVVSFAPTRCFKNWSIQN